MRSSRSNNAVDGVACGDDSVAGAATTDDDVDIAFGIDGDVASAVSSLMRFVHSLICNPRVMKY